MKTIEIRFPDEIALKVERAAQDQGVSVQELLQTSVLEKLERDAEFKSATAYVLSKNRELYERLS
jgi:hypothetical protein